MNEMIKMELAKRGILAVLEIDDVKHAVPAAKALVAGGITAIELALRTPAAEPSIELIAKEVPEMLIGIGTVIKTEQVGRIQALGAHFAVAPGFNPRIVREAKRLDFPFAPGIATASELEGALDEGCDVLKLFPAEPLGGITYLKGMTGPYAYLNLKYIPLGGVNKDNLPLWAKEKSVIAVGGTWIAKKNLIAEENWAQIEKNAAEAMKIWNDARIK